MRVKEYNQEPLRRAAQAIQDKRKVSETCRELEVSRAHFYDVIAGRKPVSYDLLMRIATKLGVTRDEVLPDPTQKNFA